MVKGSIWLETEGGEGMKTLNDVLNSLEGLSDIELFVIDLFCEWALCRSLRELRLNKLKSVA